MSMSGEQAERAIITSALVVAIIYGYRRLEEPTQPGTSLPRLLGQGAPTTFASWATAWGTVYFMLALAGEVAPGLAGAFSILVATSAVLTNGQQLFGDLAKQTNGKAGSSPSTSKATAPNRG